MQNKLLVTSSPHLRTRNDTAQLMRDVIVALIPALIAAVWVFGFRALLLTLISAGACVFFEWGFRKLLKRSNDITDFSAVVTGILLAFCVPVTLPVWMLVAGDFFAIVLVKQLFGGIGKNFMNPALAARAFLFSWPQSMNNWTEPRWYHSNFFTPGTADATTIATPLAFIGQGNLPENASIFDAVIGNIGGSMGEVSAVALLIGAGYLLWRRVIDWRIPASYLGTVAAITLLLPLGGLTRTDSLFWNLFSGGLILGTFFMAVDYTTCPVNPTAKIVYGVGCGVITAAIRAKGGYPEGVTYAILVMNAVSPLIDRYFPRKRFGEGGKRIPLRNITPDLLIGLLKKGLSAVRKNRMVVVLAIICAAAAIALGAVNSVTEKPISDNLRDKSEAAMREVFASSYYDEIEFDAARHPLVTRFYEADGGYVAEVAPNGFNGAVTLMVGICADEGNQDEYLTISGVAVVSHSETSGLGAEAQNPDWLAQFVGNRHSELSKDGGSIDALTGATITSRAVVSGVNAAIALVTDAENISGAASATEDQLAKEDVYAK